MKILRLLPVVILATVALAQERPIRLPGQPAVSPDGAHVAFTWQRDIWLAPTVGGTARRLTAHPAEDSSPWFSPDGTQIAFLSDRTGSTQIHLVPTSGGAPRAVTADSDSKRLFGFAADGGHLLVGRSSDRGFHYSESQRLHLVALAGDAPERRLFDAGFAEAALSPDRTKVLFTRGRAAWNRKGYQGPQASQLWLADLATSPPTLRRLDRDRPHFQNVSEMEPMWAPDGEGYYFVSDPDGTFDVWYRRLDGTGLKRITNVGAKDRSDDGVAFPSLSRDGSTLVFRRRFDLQRVTLADRSASPIALQASGDEVADFIERPIETSADAVAFTEDGKQMAFVSGEDVYVMDRILKEPVRVTSTPHREDDLVFSADGKRLFFVSDASGEADIWEATTKQEKGIWWLAEDFELRKVTDDKAVESGLTLSPTGKHVAYVKGTELFVMDADGTDHRRIVATWSTPSFDWSPDGKWLVYATEDSDYNSDVFIVPLDGTREPFNLSRHPDRDGSPTWSRDGKRIAFVGRRDGDESDIYYVNVAKQVEEDTDRDRRMKEALEAMEKKGGGSRRGGGAPAGAGASADEPAAGAGPGGGRRGGRPGGGRRGRRGPGGDVPPSEPTGEETAAADDEKTKTETVDVVIDFDGILDRIHRIRIGNSFESGLIWSPDGEKLAFNATIDGASGLYTVSFPDPGRPTKLADSGLRSARWLKEPNEIVGLASGRGGDEGDAPPRGRRGGRFGGGGGVPAAMSARGAVTSFAFSIRREKDWREIRQIAFDQGWRAMRDRFYDERMNNRDWETVRKKYRPVAAQCLGADEFSDLMNMMLGELNASHMGHRGGSDPLPREVREATWSPTTHHLGLRFSAGSGKTGLVVESVIPGGPCAQARSRVEAGETVLAVDDEPVGADVDLIPLLTFDSVRDVALTVANKSGEERRVTVRPVASVRGLLYDEWVEDTRRRVAELSGGRFGYLHIQGMDQSSLLQMEEDLYHAGVGKVGLIIDVRFNGGGSTTDHVLTALTQPRHAITVSRGSGEGYPQDRKVYASWHRPIIVMCNEHSFSNAEIFSHAVKQIGRGRVVGMRTAGGVISTGSARLLDGSTVRMPTRGWYLVSNGADMELNGCEPHVALWNPPDGPDLQLEAAVAALAEDVAAAKPDPSVVPASVLRQGTAPSGTPGGSERD